MPGWTKAFGRSEGRLMLALLMGTAALVVFSSSVAAQIDPVPPPGACVGEACLQQRPAPVLLLEREEAPWRCGVGRVAAWTGVVGAALAVGATVPLGFAREGVATRAGWGVYAGAVGVLIPVVALGAYAPRRVCKAQGHPPARFVGWWSYAGAMPLSIYAFTRALKEDPPGMLPSVLVGTLAAVSLLHHSFDAYLSWRQARGPALRVHIGPVSGLSLAF
jgi:hypothetical protein